MEANDPYNLQRFIDAQGPVYEQVLSELRAGHKTSHWMWFVFPQIAGLGRSPMAQRFAIGGREEAIAYSRHPLLGFRLRECTGLVNAVEGRTAHQIFGSPDDLKFRSCLTLFSQCADDPQLFLEALQKYYGGETDTATTSRL